ncbi:MAG: class I SAM-dependent rRNA methyltransferase [Pirellulaceae bacterium]|nr:class I SAM-dependent rRNA methyltransferase [Pirellulaceae bacterium]
MQLFLNPKSSRSFDGFHPWVLQHSLAEPTTPPEPGQIVELLTHGQGWIGRGVYNPASRIRVRLYEWQRDRALDETWLQSELDRAAQLRQAWMSRHGTLDAVRWVNSEGDGLSGLVVDQFGEFVVVQLTALAMFHWQPAVIDWLVERLKPQGILVRIDAATARAEGLQPQEEWVQGRPPDGPIKLREGPVHLSIELGIGQKTGYYLDQRANRMRAAQWMGSGPVLDVCCYLGGFSLAAHAQAKPASITAVDSSMRALQQAEHHAQLNGAEIDFVQADCFDYTSALVDEGRRFETVILDPPRMASQRGQIQAALRAYHRLNLSAVNLLQPGGMLVTCSCSGRISRADLMGVLASVARRTRRRIQVVESLGADFDHPIAAHCPESEYLKCLICRVE